MKTEIEQLVNRLASKELTFGCRVTLKNYNQIEETRDLFFVGDAVDKEGNDAFMIMAKSYTEKPLYQVWDKYDIVPIGHDLLIGDILELMEKKTWGASVRGLIQAPNNATIIDLWTQCRTASDIENRKTGLTKSLQEIIAGTEWTEESKCGACGEWWSDNPCPVMSGREDPMPHQPEPFSHSFPKSPAVERLVGNLLNLDL